MPFQEGPPGFGGSQIRLAMGLLPCEHLGGRVCCRTNVACSAIRIFSDEQRKCSCFIFLKPVSSSPGEPAPLSSRRKGCEQPWLLNVLGQMPSFQQSVQVFGEKCSTPTSAPPTTAERAVFCMTPRYCREAGVIGWGGPPFLASVSVEQLAGIAAWTTTTGSGCPPGLSAVLCCRCGTQTGLSQADLAHSFFC